MNILMTALMGFSNIMDWEQHLHGKPRRDQVRGEVLKSGGEAPFPAPCTHDSFRVCQVLTYPLALDI